MKKSLRLFFLMVLLLFSSVHSFSADKQVDSIPFSFEGGNIIVSISIQNKNYNFLFSSTGYSSVSNEIIAEYNLKVNTQNQTVKDVLFYSVNELKIGKTFFRNIDAKAVNFNTAFNFKCKQIQGIIGADILSKMVWKIDYNNKEILFSDAIKDFEFSNKVKTIDFKTVGNNYTPLLSLNVQGEVFENVRLSLGFNGSINLPIKGFKEKINDFKNVKYVGTERFSIKSDAEMFEEVCTMIPSVTIKNHDVGPTMICFFNKGLSLIGNKILKDYDVTIDWKNKKLYLDNYNSHENYKIEDYGFYFNKTLDKIEVVGIYINSNADKQGLKNGDLLLKVNDINLAKMSEEELCDLNYNFKNYFNNKDISITVLRGSQELHFTISKQIIID